MATFGEMVKEARDRKGWTVLELALRLGVAQSTVSRLEGDEYVQAPKPELMAAIERVLGIPQPVMLSAIGYSIGENAPPYDELATSLAAVARKWTPAQRKAAWDLFVSIEAAMNANDPPVVDDDDNGLTATGD